MKKILAILMILSICTGLFLGCEKECDHDWEDATCDEPKTCSICDETKGKPLGHTPGEEEVVDADFVAATYTVAVTCSVCDETYDEVEKTMDTFVVDDLFIFSGSQFLSRLENALEQINGCNLTVDEEIYSGKFSGKVMSGYSAVGFFYFYDEYDKQTTSGSEFDLSNFGFISDKADVFTYCLIGTIMASDPTLSQSDASNISEKVVNTMNDYSGYTYNDVNYTCSYSSGSYILLVNPDA